MIVTKKDPKDVPVSVFISVSMIVIFLLFNTQVINAVPCGKNIGDVFKSNFVHIDMAHLISNLYALYALSRVEQEMGLKPFVWLVIFLLIFNTLAEFLLRYILPNSKCAIGFSGILFGIMTWELVSKRQIDIEIMLAIVIMVVGPSLKSKNVSFTGHAIGAISGIIGGIVWKMIHK